MSSYWLNLHVHKYDNQALKWMVNSPLHKSEHKIWKTPKSYNNLCGHLILCNNVEITFRLVENNIETIINHIFCMTYIRWEGERESSFQDNTTTDKETQDDGKYDDN